MVYSTKIEKTEERLNWLVDKALSLEEGQFLEAIQNKKLKFNDVVDLLENVIEWHNRLNKEIRSLNAFSKEFNTKFATDDNQRYTTAQLLFNRIRSGIGGAKKFYKKFCPTVRKNYANLPWPDKEKHIPNAIERSYLSSLCYCPSLFGFDQYPIAVYHLYSELSMAIKDLAMGLLICRNVLREEAAIRKDISKLKRIYEDNVNACAAINKKLINYIVENGDKIPSSQLSDLKSKSNLHDFLINGYHYVNEDDFSNFVIRTKIAEGDNKGLVGLERVFWINNPEIANKMRIVMLHFDELDLKIRAQNQVSAETIVYLMKWCEIIGSGFESKFIEKYLPQNYSGKYAFCSEQAINKAKKKLLADSNNYASFVASLESLLNKYSQNA